MGAEWEAKARKSEEEQSHMLPYIEHFLVDSLRARSPESLLLVSCNCAVIAIACNFCVGFGIGIIRIGIVSANLC